MTTGLELIQLVQEISKRDADGNYIGTWTLIDVDDTALSFVEDKTLRLVSFRIEKMIDMTQEEQKNAKTE